MPRKNEGTSRGRTTIERESERALVTVRTFDAPAHVLFDARTKPELMKRWWTPRSLGVSLFECESDLRTGGTYRYVFGRDPKHPEVFSGRYIEVMRPTRLVHTQVYERMREAGEAMVTVTFEEIDGTTRLTLHQLFPTKEVLEGAVASGMEHGMRVTFDQLGIRVSSLAEARSAQTIETRD